MLERKENISTLLTSVLPGSTILDLRLSLTFYTSFTTVKAGQRGEEKETPREREREIKTQREHTGTRSEVL